MLALIAINTIVIINGNEAAASMVGLSEKNLTLSDQSCSMAVPYEKVNISTPVEGRLFH